MDKVYVSDVLLLFCSPNALKSKAVRREWRGALKIKKVVIPIFVKAEDIPVGLKERGVQFDPLNFRDTVDAIHHAILLKYRQSKSQRDKKKIIFK